MDAIAVDAIAANAVDAPAGDVGIDAGDAVGRSVNEGGAAWDGVQDTYL